MRHGHGFPPHVLRRMVASVSGAAVGPAETARFNRIKRGDCFRHHTAACADPMVLGPRGCSPVSRSANLEL